MIDLERARELLLAAVETRGRDFQYWTETSPHGCFYGLLAEQPSSAFVDQIRERVRPDDARHITPCLIGVALELAGETRQRAVRTRARELPSRFPDMLTPEAAEYLDAAQYRQDNAGTWGQAYDDAEYWYAQRRAVTSSS